MVSVLDMFVNWEIRRESCLFLPFFSESETISCWWSGAGQIKIYFVAIPKYLQTLHQQKILKTFPLLQGQPGCLKGLPALFKLFSFASTKLYITLLFHSDVLNVTKLTESVWKVQKNDIYSHWKFWIFQVHPFYDMYCL